MSAGKVRVCARGDVPPGEVRGFEVEGVAVAVYNLEGEFLATDDICSHEYALLSDGYVDEGCIECPRHGSQFDIRSGRALTLPATGPVRTFALSVEGDEVMMDPPTPPAWA